MGLGPGAEARAELATLESQPVATQNKRDDADKASIAAIQLAVKAAKANPRSSVQRLAQSALSSPS